MLSFADIQYFDAKDDVAIQYRQLPHWSQAGTLCFITWRTDDSIPAPVLANWMAERTRWLHQHGINPAEGGWRKRLADLPPDTRAEYHRRFTNRWNEWLDDCHGECVLKRPELSEIVAKSLWHFHTDRYLLTDYVVMPTHVHVLAAFTDEDTMLLQCESWKRYTATNINRALGRKGRFWQEDAFDHLVRSELHFQWFRRYIAENPIQARLAEGEYRHESLSK
jgi:REP element-mobilizing transposase RayT